MGAQKHIDPLDYIRDRMTGSRIISCHAQIGLITSRLFELEMIDTPTDEEKAEEKALKKYLKSIRKLDKRGR